MAQSSPDLGPFGDERSAAAASSWAREGRPPGLMGACNREDLFAACEAAGVELGAYDRTVLDWLGSYEPSTTAVVCGLIRRAARAAHAGV